MLALLLTSLMVVAIITNGLLAGLFFVFTVAIGPGFRNVDDSTYAQAFRSINTAILSGGFLSVFFLAPLTTVTCVVLHLWVGATMTLPVVIAAAVCSMLSFGITAVRNVPLNRELEEAPITTEEDCRRARLRYETRWNHSNLARTATSTGALTLLAAALSLG